LPLYELVKNRYLINTQDIFESYFNNKQITYDDLKEYSNSLDSLLILQEILSKDIKNKHTEWEQIIQQWIK